MRDNGDTIYDRTNCSGSHTWKDRDVLKSLTEVVRVLISSGAVA